MHRIDGLNSLCYHRTQPKAGRLSGKGLFSQQVSEKSEKRRKLMFGCGPATIFACGPATL